MKSKIDFLEQIDVDENKKTKINLEINKKYQKK